MNDFDGLKFFLEFKEACGDEDENIYIPDPVSKDALECFNLANEIDIKRFIFGDGLKSVVYTKEEEWRICPPPEKPLSAHAYNFVCKGSEKSGYLSIVYRPKRQMWILKSFKKFDKTRHLRAIR